VRCHGLSKFARATFKVSEPPLPVAAELANNARVSHQHFGRVNGGANDSRQSRFLDGPSFRYEVRKLIPKFPMQATHVLRLRFT
jgi:hypothetical protein